MTVFSVTNALLTSLGLLGFPPETEAGGAVYGSGTGGPLQIDALTFAKANPKAAEALLHFLWTRIDPAASAHSLKSCWPILGPDQAREFRVQQLRWLETLKKAGVVPGEVPVRKSELDSCRGRNLERLLLCLANHALRVTLARDTQRQLAVPVASGILASTAGDPVKRSVLIPLMFKTFKVHLVRETRALLVQADRLMHMQNDCLLYAQDLVLLRQMVTKRGVRVALQHH